MIGTRSLFRYSGEVFSFSPKEALWVIGGRFLVDAWCKHRTYYAVTDRRVLIVQEAWGRNTRSPYLSAIPEIALEGTSTGTLWLGPKLPILGAKGAPKRNMSRFCMGQR